MTKPNRIKLLLLFFSVTFVIVWLYLNRPVYYDMTAYAPSDCLGFVEANDLLELARGVELTSAWKSLAGPIGAEPTLVASQWLVRIARWTGVGSIDTILLARSQVALVFNGATGNQSGSTLTIKPLITIIIETHTTQRRMRPALESHIAEFARRLYQQPVEVRKQLDDVELNEWTSGDGSRRIIVAFVGTAAIIGNDEPSVVHSVQVRTGKTNALSTVPEVNELRNTVNASRGTIFGFASKSGAKSLLLAYALRSNSSSEAILGAQILSDTVGNLIEGLGWSAQFVDGMVEDRCSIKLAPGVAERLRPSIVPQERLDITNLPFVPTDANSVSIYHFRDVEGLWHDLNTVVASHSDVLGAIAARPLFGRLLEPYGVKDPETFVHSVGTRLQTVRFDEDSPSVLVTEAFDRQGLRKLIEQRLGKITRGETVGEEQLSISASDNWAAAFADRYFLMGPAERVRRCLEAKPPSMSLTSTDSFRKSQQLVDVSLPITVLTFTNDQRSSISFVELFAQHERSTFSRNATTITQAAKTLPYAVSVTLLKEPGLEWTSRSSFGLLGSLLIRLAPENVN